MDEILTQEEIGALLTIPELRASLEDGDEQRLADVFASVDNKRAQLHHQLNDDPPTVSEEEYSEWAAFDEELAARMCAIIAKRKIPRPDSAKPYRTRGEEFMALYGYTDADGWWRKQED